MKKYDIDWMLQQYRDLAEKFGPIVRAALARELRVPEQDQFSEAWLGYALFQEKAMVSLDLVLGQADILNAAVPTAEEVAGAFLRLKKRGWLAVEGDSYGLTSEGRRTIDKIVSQPKVYLLTKWITDHPPTGPITAEDVSRSLWGRRY